ncbi:predicted protein [Sclerotinia sclerotiorum 1980 UF-70]|uniref:Uncharacterized protein n=1 Tax=Sclerotinia sclerotiorum (strain ATCC 18683 / 1980 / Ss-1) TaxID=665079 RepID=A7EN81_SCLS1|nr:predicted protein [Sclerotinia sclerotiorum 1980 UF-70]EDO04297.1 predicted protein [Sclerotinia sclerotiorum 1980 UF-70]
MTFEHKGEDLTGSHSLTWHQYQSKICQRRSLIDELSGLPAWHASGKKKQTDISQFDLADVMHVFKPRPAGTHKVLRYDTQYDDGIHVFGFVGPRICTSSFIPPSLRYPGFGTLLPNVGKGLLIHFSRTKGFLDFSFIFVDIS